MHSLVNFVEAISGAANRSKKLKRIFDASVFNTPENQKQLEEFDRVRGALNNGYVYPGFPDDRYAGQRLADLFEIQCAFSNSLEDLRQRSLGLLSPGDQDRLISAIAYWEPIYSSLIWNSNLEKLAGYRDQLESSAQTWKMQYVLGQAAKFYKTEWPEKLPVTLSLIPIPGKSESSNGRSIGPFEAVEVVLEETDLVGRYGVIVHELAHSFFGAQAASTQWELDSLYLQHHSAYARYAYWLLNEALATAIGNGWAYEVATGELDPGSWYNDPYIDAFAHGLYGHTKEYLEHDRPIDSAFVSFSVNEYERLFPNAPRQYDVVLDRVILGTDEVLFHSGDVGAALWQRFRVSSIWSVLSPDSSEAESRIKSSRNTLVLVLSKTQLGQLTRLAPVIPHAMELIEAATNQSGNFLLSTLDSNFRPYIVLVLESERDLASGFSLMAKLKFIDDTRPIIRF